MLLAGQTAPTEDLKGLAIIISTLKAHITDAPDWWIKCDHGMKLDDENCL